MKLYHRTSTLLSWTVLALVAAAIAVLYAREVSQLRAHKAAAAELETVIHRVRTVLNRMPPAPEARPLLSDEGLSAALGEMTSYGKLEGVNFLSMTPEAPAESERPYRVVPVVMELQATYQAMGEFLGALDEFEKGYVTVGHLELTPDEKNKEQVLARLTVNFYLEAAHGG